KTRKLGNPPINSTPFPFQCSLPDLVFRTVNDSCDGGGLCGVCGAFACEGGCDRGAGCCCCGGHGLAGLPTCRTCAASSIMRSNCGVVSLVGGPRLPMRLAC